MDFRGAPSWRVFRHEDDGQYYMYFDASRETPGVRDLTEDEKSARLDKLVSVSGLVTPSGMLRDQMDAFQDPRAVLEGPGPLFLETLWEGGSDGDI